MAYELNIHFLPKVKKQFDKFYKNSKTKAQVFAKIEKIVISFIDNNDNRYIFTPDDPIFKHCVLSYAESTIFAIRLPEKKLILLTIDNDPIFEQVLIYLIAFCSVTFDAPHSPSFSPKDYNNILSGVHFVQRVINGEEIEDIESEA